MFVPKFYKCLLRFCGVPILYTNEKVPEPEAELNLLQEKIVAADRKLPEKRYVPLRWAQRRITGFWGD